MDFKRGWLGNSVIARVQWGTTDVTMTLEHSSRARAISGPLRLVSYCNAAYSSLSFKSMAVNYTLSESTPFADALASVCCILYLYW